MNIILLVACIKLALKLIKCFLVFVSFIILGVHQIILNECWIVSFHVVNCCLAFGLLDQIAVEDHGYYADADRKFSNMRNGCINSQTSMSLFWQTPKHKFTVLLANSLGSLRMVCEHRYFNPTDIMFGHNSVKMANIQWKYFTLTTMGIVWNLWVLISKINIIS